MADMSRHDSTDLPLSPAWKIAGRTVQEPPRSALLGPWQADGAGSAAVGQAPPTLSPAPNTKPAAAAHEILPGVPLGAGRLVDKWAGLDTRGIVNEGPAHTGANTAAKWREDEREVKPPASRWINPEDAATQRARLAGEPRPSLDRGWGIEPSAGRGRGRGGEDRWSANKDWVAGGLPGMGAPADLGEKRAERWDNGAGHAPAHTDRWRAAGITAVAPPENKERRGFAVGRGRAIAHGGLPGAPGAPGGPIAARWSNTNDDHAGNSNAGRRYSPEQMVHVRDDLLTAHHGKLNIPAGAQVPDYTGVLAPESEASHAPRREYNHQDSGNDRYALERTHSAWDSERNQPAPPPPPANAGGGLATHPAQGMGGGPVAGNAAPENQQGKVVPITTLVGTASGVLPPGMGLQPLQPQMAPNLFSPKAYAANQWVYRDPQGVVQGPFTQLDIIEWQAAGYFNPDLPVRSAVEGNPDSWWPLATVRAAWDDWERMKHMVAPPPMGVPPGVLMPGTAAAANASLLGGQQSDLQSAGSGAAALFQRNLLGPGNAMTGLLGGLGTADPGENGGAQQQPLDGGLGGGLGLGSGVGWGRLLGTPYPQADPNAGPGGFGMSGIGHAPMRTPGPDEQGGWEPAQDPMGRPGMLPGAGLHGPGLGEPQGPLWGNFQRHGAGHLDPLRPNGPINVAPTHSVWAGRPGAGALPDPASVWDVRGPGAAQHAGPQQGGPQQLPHIASGGSDVTIPSGWLSAAGSGAEFPPAPQHMMPPPPLQPVAKPQQPEEQEANRTGSLPQQQVRSVAPAAPAPAVPAERYENNGEAEVPVDVSAPPPVARIAPWAGKGGQPVKTFRQIQEEEAMAKAAALAKQQEAARAQAQQQPAAPTPAPNQQLPEVPPAVSAWARPGAAVVPPPQPTSQWGSGVLDADEANKAIAAARADSAQAPAAVPASAAPRPAPPAVVGTGPGPRAATLAEVLEKMLPNAAVNTGPTPAWGGAAVARAPGPSLRDVIMYEECAADMEGGTVEEDVTEFIQQARNAAAATAPQQQQQPAPQQQRPAPPVRAPPLATAGSGAQEDLLWDYGPAAGQPAQPPPPPAQQRAAARGAQAAAAPSLAALIQASLPQQPTAASTAKPASAWASTAAPTAPATKASVWANPAVPAAQATAASKAAPKLPTAAKATAVPVSQLETPAPPPQLPAGTASPTPASSVMSSPTTLALSHDFLAWCQSSWRQLTGSPDISALEWLVTLESRSEIADIINETLSGKNGAGPFVAEFLRRRDAEMARATTSGKKGKGKAGAGQQQGNEWKEAAKPQPQQQQAKKAGGNAGKGGKAGRANGFAVLGMQ